MTGLDKNIEDTIWGQYREIINDKQAVNENDKNDENDIICSNCKQYVSIDYTNGVYVCAYCGVIKHEYIFDEQAEWVFNASENTTGKKDPSRCGAPINQLLEKSSMSTMIGGKNNTFMKKLHMQMSMNYVERARYHVFEKIQQMAGERGGLSQNVIEQAKYYYKVISSKKLSRGSVRNGLIACCILYACKYFKVSRSIKEISCMCEVSPTKINETSKIFLKLMEEDTLNTYSSNEILTKSTDYMDLINRFIGKLELDTKTEKCIMKSVRKLDETIRTCDDIDSKTPSSVAAGILLYVCNANEIQINKKIFSAKINVSIVTINKMYKIINQYLSNYEKSSSNSPSPIVI